MDQEELMVREAEQQLAPHFRQSYRTELHFMRLLCQPSKQQYERIAADGEPVLKETIKKFAVIAYRQVEKPYPRELIADALLKLVRTTLSPEQAARYQKELDQRSAARKRAVVQNLVAKVDHALVLTAEQRGKLAEILENNWQDSWNKTQLFMYDQPFPNMPDAKILPILTETQRIVWQSIPKSVNFGFDLGTVRGIELEEEVWDDDRPLNPPNRRDGRAAVKNEGTTKPVEKQ
jgi:hypothetical protein